MHKNRILIFSIVFLIGQNLYCQNKPGYFDYSRIEPVLPSVGRAEEHMKAFGQQLTDSITILQNNLQNLYSGHGCGRQLDSAKKADMEAALNKANDAVLSYQNSAQKRYTKEWDDLRAEMKNKTVLIIKEFCLKNKIDVMVEKEAMIYCADCKDYTDEIIEYISSINIK